MNLKAHLARILIGSFLMAILVIVILKPQVQIPAIQYAIIVFIVEIAGSIIASVGNGNAPRQFFRILAISFIFSAIFVIWLKTSLSYEQTFLAVFAVQILGLSVAALGTRSNTSIT